eukprot:5492934-Pleurochrysis_carterae.AAC.1
MAASLEYARATECAQVNACVGTLVRASGADIAGGRTRYEHACLREHLFASAHVCQHAAAAIRVCVKTWTSPLEKRA